MASIAQCQSTGERADFVRIVRGVTAVEGEVTARQQNKIATLGTK